MTGFRWVVLAAALACAPWHGTARAEPGLFIGGSCMPLSTAGATCSPGETCRMDGTGATGTCRGFGMLTVCLPDDAMICCDEDMDCPTDIGGTLRACVRTPTVGLCPAPGADYCSMGVRPSSSELLLCHRDGSGTLVTWDRGDCDGDTVPNGVEESLGTDPCLAPARQAIWVGTANTCIPLPIGCDPSMSCSTPAGTAGECRDTADDGATQCEPREAALHCGDGAWVCPGGQIEVEDADARHTYCSPPYCGDDHALTTAACVRSPITGDPVPPDQGDCDHDGVPNGMDDEVCVPFEPGEDAGTNTRDGGDALPDGAIPGEDAGAGEDAAVEPMDGGEASTDAGANVAPTFGGGGGCACGAGPGDAGSAFGLLAALGVALSLRAGRRARRTR